MIPIEFPCLGLHFLGNCSYNPAQPNPIYFNVGNAISALAFTLAVQQFLKPIYKFRLAAYGIKAGYLTLGIFFGVLCSLVAAIIPNLPLSHDSFWEYPISWELIGAASIIFVYGFTTFIALRPARVTNFNLLPFVKAAGKLLSEADDDDRVRFSEDLARNISSLIGYAKFWEAAEAHSAMVEFERLRERGARPEIRGRVPLSAFYLFTHRKSHQRARIAASLLRLLSDSKFCAALVIKSPWRTAYIMRDLSKRALHVNAAEGFVQGVAHQAVLNDESIMAREIGYDGFGHAPILSESLFSDWQILTNYRPMQKMQFSSLEKYPEGYISRLNGAGELMLETAIVSKDYAQPQYMYDLEAAYKGVLGKVRYSSDKDGPIDLPIGLHLGFSKMIRTLMSEMEKLDENTYRGLFVTDEDKYRGDLVHTVASIIFESLEVIANSFTGYTCGAWVHAIDTYMEMYPFFEGEPAGMNSFQQQLAIMLINKLQHNMDGMYPAISRVLLAVVGPYKEHAKIKNRSAYVIFQDAVYKELQKLPALYKKSPEKFLAFLPTNVIYDAASNSLTHTYAGGSTRVTNLSSLVIPEVNLFDEANRRSYKAEGDQSTGLVHPAGASKAEGARDAPVGAPGSSETAKPEQAAATPEPVSNNEKAQERAAPPSPDKPEENRVEDHDQK